MPIRKKKISELTLADSMLGLYTIGVKVANGVQTSVKVGLEYIQTAYENVIAATKKALDAATAADTSRKNIEAKESERQSNETARVNVEAVRKTAEIGRVNAESSRVTVETARVNAEGIRITKETERQNKEAARITEEGKRATAESGRVAEEGKRNTAESARVSVETARVNAESTRVTEESKRSTEEGKRVSAETGRVTVESIRVTEEGKRVTAESARVSVETARVNAESTRVAEFGKIKTDAAAATKAATDAAGDVDEAKQAALDAAASVDAAKKLATEAAANADTKATSADTSAKAADAAASNANAKATLANTAAGSANVAAQAANSAATTIDSKIDSKIDALVADAPDALDTLKELATALGNDPNFATTMATEMAKKLAKTDVANSLTNTAIDKPLSAAQGKVLNDKVEYRSPSGRFSPDEGAPVGWYRIAVGDAYPVAKTALVTIGSVYNLNLPQAFSFLISQLGGDIVVKMLLKQRVADAPYLIDKVRVLAPDAWQNHSYIDIHYAHSRFNELLITATSVIGNTFYAIPQKVADTPPEGYTSIEFEI